MPAQDRRQAATVAAHASGERVEICGVATLTEADVRRMMADPGRGQAWEQEVQAQMQRRAQANMARIAARLAAGNERQQVAARLLMNDRENAAILAEHSTDPMIYQMALMGCDSAGDAAPHCARLSARRWAELDPSDARPWLRLMDEARRRQDGAGMDAALAEAAARPRLSRFAFLLEAQAVGAADAIPDLAEQGEALVAVIGIDAAMQSLDAIAPIKHCSGDGLRDATRLAHCRALARQVLANTADLGEAQIAQRMAERVGVPREQQAHDAATLQAAQERLMEWTLTDSDMSCATLRRFRQLSVDRAASGDLPLALALLPPRLASPASGPH
jgi:hypothetical protein